MLQHAAEFTLYYHPYNAFGKIENEIAARTTTESRGTHNKSGNQTDQHLQADQFPKKSFQTIKIQIFFDNHINRKNSQVHGRDKVETTICAV
ncbi:hypothetical protein RB195_016179 [Necator americanus]|uniref:Uncharacterized protein n=1 Tax=Necator americanus TaxID=51031 RepID=A0ABR1E7X4_NECAM